MVRGVPSLAMLRPAAAAAAMLLVAPPLHVLPSARRPLHVPTEAHAIVPAIRSAVCRQQPSATRHRPAQAVLADPEEAHSLEILATSAAGCHLKILQSLDGHEHARSSEASMALVSSSGDDAAAAA